ncbi:unnamed protein product [Adineta steineri]|uniref:Uncharacterized protein n=2 Tax=Adineta steineri TaxID=433720 RepID=A0A813WN30_9BILA|nr:unnamed protein product [Adineta steineri]
MNDIEEIYLPSHNQHETVSKPNQDWVSVTHNRLSKRFKIWIGVCTVLVLQPQLLKLHQYLQQQPRPRVQPQLQRLRHRQPQEQLLRHQHLRHRQPQEQLPRHQHQQPQLQQQRPRRQLQQQQQSVSQLPLVSINGTIIGIYKTTVGTNSTTATPGNYIGQYIPTESPYNACDNNTGTKYLSFGTCGETTIDSICGLNTGLYLELQRGSSLIIGLQMCTGNDYPERDPFIVSLEGSNLSGTVLNLGTSWTLIYNGSSGLQIDPGRSTCGRLQSINNTIQYKSYRFLVSAKRSISNSVQYSEIHLYGY